MAIVVWRSTVKMQPALWLLVIRPIWIQAASSENLFDLVDQSKCDCCDEATLHAYAGELRRHCLPVSRQEEEVQTIVVGEALDGSPSVSEDALHLLCSSPLCRSSVLRFWARVRGCSEASSWKRYGFAWIVAKVRCMRLPQEAEPVDGQRYQALMQATFGHEALLVGSGGLAAATSAVKEALLDSLWNGVELRASQEGLRVQVARAIYSPPSADPELRTPVAVGQQKCMSVTSTWPADGEQDLGIGLRYLVLHFDRCATVRNAAYAASLLGSGSGCDGQIARVSLSDPEARFPADTLIFKPDQELTAGCCYRFSIAQDAIQSCNNGAYLCEKVETNFCTSQPRPTPKSNLVDDRWLRTIFDMPIKLNESSKHSFRLQAGPASQFDEEESLADLLKVAAWFHLDPSSNMFWVQDGDETLITGNAQIQDNKDGTGSVSTGAGLPGTKIYCAYRPEARGSGIPCFDHRSFETDMCSIIGNCPDKKRLPCEMVMEAYYPPGLALKEGMGSAQVRDVQRTRKCRPPHLLEKAVLEVENERLLFKWSEAAEVANPLARLWLCKSASSNSGRFCIVHALPVGDPSVSPCAGGSASCDEWALDLGKAASQACGQLELRVEKGAVRAVGGEDDSEESRVDLSNIRSCLASQVQIQELPGVTAGSVGCAVMYDSGLVEHGAAEDNLMKDIHDVHLSFSLSTTKAAFLQRLLDGPAKTPCAIIPKLAHRFWNGHEATLFEYVLNGGQLYIAGGRINRDILRDVFGLAVQEGSAGNVQQLNQQGFDNEEARCAQHWLKELPVLTNLESVRLAAMAASVSGHTVFAKGLYSSDGRGQSFGVLQAELEQGLIEYLAFDWTHPSAEARRPWAMILSLLEDCNAARRQVLHKGGNVPRLLAVAEPFAQANTLTAGRLNTWEEISPDTGTAAEPDLEVTIALECKFHSESSGSMPSGQLEAHASSCNGVRERLLDVLLEPASGFYTSLQEKAFPLRIQRYSPPLILEVLSECPSIEDIEASVLLMNAACGFQDTASSDRYTSSISFARLNMIQTTLGVELLNNALREEVCRRPLCRARALAARRLTAGCPESAGHKGVIARIVGAIDTTTGSCLEVHSATQGGASHPQVQPGKEKDSLRGVWSSDMSEVNDAVIAGIDTSSAPEMASLERAVKRILAQNLGLPAFALQEPGASLADVFDPLLGGPNVLQVSDTSLRVAAQVTPLPPGEPFDEEVALMYGSLRQEIPITQKLEFEAGHNLQMLAIEPQWNEQDVDPAAGRIRVIFEDLVAKDDLNAIIRVFPTHLREICMGHDPGDPGTWKRFPSETGLGGLMPAGGAANNLRPHEDTPVAFVCQAFPVSDDSRVLVSGQVLQIDLEHSLMRNTEYVVMLPARIVQAALGSTAFAGARWSGWPAEEGQGNQEYIFKTGIPRASNARLSVAMSCSSDRECRKQRRALSETGMQDLADRSACFVAWFRCQEDPVAESYCRQPPGMRWCDVHGQWDPSWQAPSHEEDEEEDLEMSSVPEQAVSEAEAIYLPDWVYVCALAAWLQNTFAALRAAWWVLDLYLESRHYDPYVAQVSRSMPVVISTVAMALPPLTGLLGALVSVAFFRAVVYSIRPIDFGSGEVAWVDARRLHSQLASGFCVSFCACEAVITLIAYGTIARFKDRFADKGQLAALCAVGFAAIGLTGGANGWIAHAGVQDMASPEAGLSWAVISLILGTGIVQLAALILGPAAIFWLFFRMRGMGDILRYSIYFQFGQLSQWWKGAGVQGQWSSWVLLIREIQGFKGFVESIRDFGGDGALFLNFYCSNTPFNTTFTRTHTVRYSSDAVTEQKFEGEDIFVNITDPFSVMVVEVMFQPQGESRPERVAEATWDPWCEVVLDRFFSNKKFCQTTRHDSFWNPKDLFKADGPHAGVFLEVELNLTEDRMECTPELGVLKFQVTHLGPLASRSVRRHPWHLPERVLAMGDTLPPRGRFGRWSKRPEAEVRKSSYVTGRFRRSVEEEEEEQRRQLQRQQIRQQLPANGIAESRQPVMRSIPEAEPLERGESGLWTLRFSNLFGGSAQESVHRHPHANTADMRNRIVQRGAAVQPTRIASRDGSQESGSRSFWNDLFGPPQTTVLRTNDRTNVAVAGPPHRTRSASGEQSAAANGRRDLSMGGLSDWLGDVIGTNNNGRVASRELPAVAPVPDLSRRQGVPVRTK